MELDAKKGVQLVDISRDRHPGWTQQEHSGWATAGVLLVLQHIAGVFVRADRIERVNRIAAYTPEYHEVPATHHSRLASDFVGNQRELAWSD
ncbi:MAG: hypothetical protein AAGJ46_09720 [Planctomycetota bacterium]